MKESSGEESMATWDVSGLIENGTYNIQIYAKMLKSDHSSRKWYNMSKPELCLYNVSEDPTNEYDKPNEDDYRYYFKFDDTIVNPNVTNEWGEMGYSANTFNYGDIVYEVSVSNVNKISLIHGNNSCPLYISEIVLVSKDMA